MIFSEADFLKAKSYINTEGTDTNVGGRIRYTGPYQSCLIQCLATTNDIKALVGVLGSEAADTDFGTNGVIDVTGKTALDIANEINSYDNYEYVIEGMRASDSVDAKFLEDTTGVQAKTPEVAVSKGAPLYLDLDEAKNFAFCISNRTFGNVPIPGGPSDHDINNEGDAINILDYFTFKMEGSGAVTLTLYYIKGDVEIESHTLTIAAYATGATTPEHNWAGTYGRGLRAPAGCRILVQATSATTLTAVTLTHALGSIVLPQGN